MDYLELDRKEHEVLIKDTIFADAWFASLPQRHKLLYIYLLTTCSKCGIFEVNMRKFNFDLTNGEEDVKPYTRDELFAFGGHRVQPLGETRGIIPAYIGYNWIRGKPLDAVKNPLHKGLMQELALYGLTFDDVNAMCDGKHAIEYVPESVHETEECIAEVKQFKTDPAWNDSFDRFWSAYPSRCPRKVDKKKCHDKWLKLMRDAKDKSGDLVLAIFKGLALWDKSEMWTSNNGQYIKAPLVWLNGACWNDEPMKGNTNGNTTGTGARRSVNAIQGTNSTLTNLF